MKSPPSKSFIEEKKIEPANILIMFLLGLAAGLFIAASVGSFGLDETARRNLTWVVGGIYIISIIALLYPKKKKTHLHDPEPQIFEKEKIVEKPVPVYRNLVKYKEKPVIKEVIKEIPKPFIKEKIIEKEKEEPKKSKYVGSKYNERYHLRSCRFAGAIKPEYLIEEDDKKYFKLRGYKACKVCHPERN